ncbi:Nitrilase family, member 2 [Seminavis robusta]|uniref:Nitrilase family, member 2 n=1 Tax=Seminavis robusta TaxID=568900 RepID=A0A9N8DUT3_9STRA|nr:Nitrilase family, member 2 [Seminavis robusta]|eukprot:Sro367_g127760.1 Nitrilase family, member 2 (301) ;mRNA; f:28495-29397
MKNTYNQQLRDIMQPHPHDVLCGRGAGVLKHIGNLRWRELIKDKQEEYVSLKKHEKMYLTESIVFAVRNLSPPGRFLQKDGRGRWFEIGDQKANEKTAQALREGAPKLRKKLQQQDKKLMKRSISVNPLPSKPLNTKPQRSRSWPTIQTPVFAQHQSFLSSENNFFNLQQQPFAMHQQQPFPTNMSNCSDPAIRRISWTQQESCYDAEPLQLPADGDDVKIQFDEQETTHLEACLGMNKFHPIDNADDEDIFSVTEEFPPAKAEAGSPRVPQKVSSNALTDLLEKQRLLFESFVANDFEL